jgi:DNA invertase Pin-like site-specific DNA recombinase
MSSENGRPSFTEIIMELKALQKEHEQIVQAARDDLERKMSEKRSIDQMLAAAERTGHYAPKPKGKKGNTLTSDENLELYWQRLQTQKFDRFEDIPNGFSAKDVSSALGVHKSTSDRVVRTLREQGRIRLVGQRYPADNPNHHGKAHAVYVING